MVETGAMLDQAALLQAAASSPDAVTLEIYWATLPEETDQTGPAFWSQVQENRLSADLRRRLARNGLRAGILSGSLPTEMHELLNPDGGPGDDSTETNTTLKQTGVWRRTRPLRPGDEIELKASEPKPSAPLLIARGDDLVGATYLGAQAFYRLEASTTPDGRSELTLTPEVQHGVAKPRWTPDETGMIAQATPRRDAEVFSDLAIRVPLSAGEALLVTSLPDSRSRLGGFLHAASESSAGLRKAILLRVVQPPRTEDYTLEEER